MPIGSLSKRLLALAVCVSVVFITIPFSAAEMMGSLPIGKITTAGKVSINGSIAPTGTVVISGESITTNEAPALITLREGSTVMMDSGATATLSQAGDTLVLRADKGVIDFNFSPAQNVRIEMGGHEFVANAGHTNAGKLAVIDNDLTIAVSSGRFSGVDTVSGKHYEVAADSNAASAAAAGKGNITKDGNVLTVPGKKWAPNSLKGKIVKIGNESHRIVSNTADTITIEGSWTVATGSYDYSIEGVAAAAGGAKSGGLSMGAKAGIALGAVAATGIGVWQGTKSK